MDGGKVGLSRVRFQETWDGGRRQEARAGTPLGVGAPGGALGVRAPELSEFCH